MLPFSLSGKNSYYLVLSLFFLLQSQSTTTTTKQNDVKCCKMEPSLVRPNTLREIAKRVERKAQPEPEAIPLNEEEKTEIFKKIDETIRNELNQGSIFGCTYEFGENVTQSNFEEISSSLIELGYSVTRKKRKLQNPIREISFITWGNCRFESKCDRKIPIPVIPAAEAREIALKKLEEKQIKAKQEFERQRPQIIERLNRHMMEAAGKGLYKLKIETVFPDESEWELCGLKDLLVSSGFHGKQSFDDIDTVTWNNVDDE
jgi:hypothetical protein